MEPDLLFTVRNNFYLGSYQHAISEASDLEGLSDQEKVERDLFVYRSYVELGSFEVRGCRCSCVNPLNTPDGCPPPPFAGLTTSPYISLLYPEQGV